MFLSIWLPDYSKKDPKEIEISIENIIGETKVWHLVPTWDAHYLRRGSTQFLKLLGLLSKRDLRLIGQWLVGRNKQFVLCLYAYV